MSTNSRWLLPLALLAAACGRLSPDPGGDFAVHVVGPSSLTVIGKLSVPLRFAVSGCDAFDPAIRIGGSSQLIGASRQGDGTWLADVPVDWLRVEDFDCLHDALRPLASRADLVVTCRDGGRSASAALEVSYATATRAYGSYGGTPVSQTRYLFPGRDPLRPYAITVSWVEQGATIFFDWRDEYPDSFGVAFENGGVHLRTSPPVEPRLVANASGSTFAYSAGCARVDHSCPAFAIDASTTVPSESIAWFGFADGNIWWENWVPQYVLDMAMIDDRHVVVLSQPAPDAWAPTSVLSLITKPEGNVAPQVTALGYFPGEWAQSRFSRLSDGRVAWLAWIVPGAGESGPLTSVLRTTDGVTVDARPDPTGSEFLGEKDFYTSTMSYTFGQLSPDASELLLSGPKLIGADGSVASLPASQFYSVDGQYGDAVWLDGAVAVSRGTNWIFGTGGTGVIEAFDGSPPHARRFVYTVAPLRGSRGSSPLYGTVAVGDKLVLTTATGVRVLGADGALVGGADPLPCGLSTTSRAARVGPTTFAVGAGRIWYVFDLAEP